MDFSTSVRTCFKKYATFSGRARRSEYWWWALFTMIASLVAGFGDVMLLESGTALNVEQDMHSADQEGPLATVVHLIMLLPSLAVSVRRLHDIGKTGWWLLFLLVPLIGLFYLIYLFVQRGDYGANMYGADPIGDDQPAQDQPIFEMDAPAPLAPPENIPKEASEPEPDVEPTEEDTQRRRSWRPPSTRDKGFKTTQDRFKDK